MDEHAERSNAIGHEPIETNVRAVWRTAAVITAVVIASYLIIIGMMKWLTAAKGRTPASYAAQTDSDWDKQNALQQLRNQEQQLLSEYQWVDPTEESARIPIDRAIEIISQNGLPVSLDVPAASDSDSPQGAGPSGDTENAEGNE